MGAGKYNKQIRIEQKIVSVDSYGQQIPAWATYRDNVWAQLQIGTGREYFAAKRTIPELSGLIFIRYIRRLRPSMRIVCEGRIYNILAIIPKGMNLQQELEIRILENVVNT